jgi:hypothetical protein
MATREQLHQLVSSLPEDALEPAHTVLRQLQAGLSPDRAAGLEHFGQAQQRVHERMQERMREMVELLATRAEDRRGEANSLFGAAPVR